MSLVRSYSKLLSPFQTFLYFTDNIDISTTTITQLIMKKPKKYQRNNLTHFSKSNLFYEFQKGWDNTKWLLYAHCVCNECDRKTHFGTKFNLICNLAVEKTLA